VVDDEHEIYDATPPPQKRVRILGPDFGEEVSGKTNTEKRHSRRQREPTIQAADMVMWKDIDGEEFGMALETSESE
jgi:hypothetical protein